MSGRDRVRNEKRRLAAPRSEDVNPTKRLYLKLAPRGTDVRLCQLH